MHNVELLCETATASSLPPPLRQLLLLLFLLFLLIPMLTDELTQIPSNRVVRFDTELALDNELDCAAT